jgi:hypothetical protein
MFEKKHRKNSKSRLECAATIVEERAKKLRRKRMRRKSGFLSESEAGVLCVERVGNYG